MMKRTGLIRILLLMAGVVVLLGLWCSPALAQCAMCRAALSGTNNTSLVRSFNLSVLVLLVPPVTIFCSIFIVAYKYRRPDKGETPDEPDDSSESQ